MNVGDLVQTDVAAYRRYPGRRMRIESIQDDVEEARTVVTGHVVRKDGTQGITYLRIPKTKVVAVLRSGSDR